MSLHQEVGRKIMFWYVRFEDGGYSLRWGRPLEGEFTTVLARVDGYDLVSYEMLDSTSSKTAFSAGVAVHMQAGDIQYWLYEGWESRPATTDIGVDRLRDFSISWTGGFDFDR